MSRLFTLIIASVLICGTPAFAQEEATPLPPPAPSADAGEASGPLNCFDYYTFGSVQADLQPTLAQTVPGTTLTFEGEVKNENSYPLLDGTLYVKIFKRNETTFAEGDGNDVVDQFVVKDGITLPGNGSTKVGYEWKVPVNAEGGEYYAAYFFTTAKRYNLMGLSFTDDVVGNQAPFTITADNTIAKLSKVDTRLNEENHNFAAFPHHFEAGTPVIITTTIENPTAEPKTLPLQWNQYAWDAMLEDNLRYTHTEIIILAPNETKTVSYEVKPQRESIVYVTAVTQDIEAKSVLNIRYVRDGIEETRINFPGLSSFPLQKDTEATLFACAHSTNLPLVPNNTLTLTLTDKDGNTIHQYKHSGDISGAMAGFGEVFKTDRNIDYAVLTATLERNGVTVEEVKQVYDCMMIDPNSCLDEGGDNNSFFDFFSKNLLTMVIAVVVLIMIAVVGVFIYRKKQGHIVASFCLAVLTGIGFLFMQPVATNAAELVGQENVGVPDLLYHWNWGRREAAAASLFGGTIPSGWEAALKSANVNVQYYVNIEKNVGAGWQPLYDGETVPAGTQLKFEHVAERPEHVSWFGTGYSSDSPNGHWVGGAGPTPFSCDPGDRVVNLGNGDAAQYYPYIPLSVNPPARNTSYSGPASAGMSCAGNICTVNSGGTLNVTFTVNPTYGKFYFRYYDSRSDFGGPGCFGNDYALRAQDGPTIPGGCYDLGEYGGYYCAPDSASPSASDHVINLSAQSRTFTFNVSAPVPANTPPSVNVTGPTSLIVGSAGTYTFTANDPEGHQVQYGVDWDNNGSVDQGNPYGTPMNSGSPLNMSHSWGSAGTYTFRYWAADVNGAQSADRFYTVTVGNAPVNGSCGGTVNSCPAGIFSDNTDNATQYLWSCNGQNGGTNASCSLPKALPDIYVTSISPTTASVGVSQSFNAYVYNQSAPTVTPFNVRFIFDTDTNTGNGSLYTAPVFRSGIPGGFPANYGEPFANASYTFATAGTYYVHTCVDVNNEVAESNEINNCGMQAVTVTGSVINGSCGATNNSCPAGLLSDTADNASNYLWSCNGQNGGTNASCSLPKTVNLRANNLTYSGTLGVGQTLSLTGTVLNNGAGNTLTGFSNAFEYRIGASGGFTPISSSGTGVLAVGSSANSNTTFTIPPGAAGQPLYLQYCVDTSWQVAESDESVADNCYQISLGVIGIPAPWANLTADGSEGPISVARNQAVTLDWGSMYAGSCSKWGGSWGSGEAIPLSGSAVTIVANTTTYMINCSGVTDTVTVNVVNQGPSAPTITYVSGVREANQTLTFSIQGSDPDGDNIFYEVDWDNNGTVDATTMTVPSGSAQNASHSWNAVGTVTFQARTVDVGGDRSGWTQHSENLSAPPPPTATLEVRVNSGSWGTGNPPLVDTNDTIRLRWSSTNASSCTGTNFNTGGATSNSGTTVTTPAPGGSTTFTLSCTGFSGTDSKSITVQAGLPNFNRPIATHNLSTTFNPTTGDYDWVTISFQTTNDGQSGTRSTAPYSLQFDSRTPVSGTIPLLARGSASPNFTHTLNTIPFGNHTATIVVDTNNSVAETNEGDNTYVYDFGGIIPPPDPQINITADRIQLRNDETTVVRWTTVGTYPTLTCSVSGPGMDVDPAPFTGNETTQPITAKSEYTFRCIETTTNTTWTDSVMVETQGEIQET